MITKIAFDVLKSINNLGDYLLLTINLRLTHGPRLLLVLSLRVEATWRVVGGRVRLTRVHVQHRVHPAPDTVLRLLALVDQRVPRPDERLGHHLVHWLQPARRGRPLDSGKLQPCLEIFLCNVMTKIFLDIET